MALAFGFSSFKFRKKFPIFCFSSYRFCYMFVLQVFLRSWFFYWHFYCYFLFFKFFLISFYAFAIKICYEVGEYYKVVELLRSFCFFELYIFLCFERPLCFFVFANVMSYLVFSISHHWLFFVFLFSLIIFIANFKIHNTFLFYLFFYYASFENGLCWSSIFLFAKKICSLRFYFQNYLFIFYNTMWTIFYFFHFDFLFHVFPCFSMFHSHDEPTSKKTLFWNVYNWWRFFWMFLKIVKKQA